MSVLKKLNPDWGVAMLRITMGVLFLAHVVMRISMVTMPVSVEFFNSVGLPSWVAYTVTATEAVCGVLLIIGWLVRLASLVCLPVLVGAIVLVHGENGFFFSNPNGGWEYPAFWVVALLAQSTFGAGAFSIDNWFSKRDSR